MTTARASFLTAAALVAAAALPGNARGGASDSYTLSSSLQCRAAKGEYDHFTRDAKGITNNQTTTRTLYCPFATPSQDSDRSQNPKLQRAEIFVNGNNTPMPVCRIYTMSQTGATKLSGTGEGFLRSDAPQVTWILYEFPTASPFASDDGRTASIGYVCDVPPGGSLWGARAQFFLSRIQGGIP